MTRLKPDDVRALYDGFNAPITRFDCGRKCAPLNGGEPLCCSSKNAVPVVHRAEWEVLRARTDLWKRFKPYDAATRRIVDELSPACAAIECKGGRFCERENRTIACRAFPFFPYLTREKDFVGLGTYWGFADRCWVISHPELVLPDFVAEFIATFERIFAIDAEEREVMAQHSASMRRVHTRQRKAFYVIDRDARYCLVKPGDPRLHPADIARHKPHPTWASAKGFAQMCRDLGHDVPERIEL
jgi:hypothetical protein